MSFSSKIKENVLVACGRYCCICHKFCGTKIELHHILPKSDGGDDSFDNCIPLCFDCHADMTSYDFNHPKGTKYKPKELQRHRNNWYAKVKNSLAIVELPEHMELDKITYRKLKAILPWDGSVYFIRTFNFAGFGFHLQDLKDLYKFIGTCEDPSFEFIDMDLEGIRSELLDKIQLFLSIIGVQTFSTHQAGINTVPPEWEDEQPERFRKVVNELHDLSEQICNNYDSLIKLSRRKLGVQ